MGLKVRNQAAICHLFEVTGELHDSELVVQLRTDLPLKTRINHSITCPGREYIWTNAEESITVTAVADQLGFDIRKSIDELERLGTTG
jgi:hypothetical protein